MNIKNAWTGAALSATLLGGCTQGGHMVNGKLCAVFKAPEASQASAAAPAPADAAAPLDACVKRWAYSLAGARDDAELVANASVAACGAELSAWNQSTPDQPTIDSTGAQVQTLSMDSGLPTNAVAEHAAFAHRKALLYVVEARAGRCRPPPVVKGVPVGG